MFNCAGCGLPTRHGKLVVRETRDKEYTETVTDARGREQTFVVGCGTEIVREERLCADCVDAAVEEAADA